MILQALVRHYETLCTNGTLSSPGWDSSFKVSFGLEISSDQVELVELRSEQIKGKKTEIAPRQMRVPSHTSRSSGISANFLCDNCTYMLGADEKGKTQRAKDCFAACAALHQNVLSGVDSPAAKAILAYFAHWDPEKAKEHPSIALDWKTISSNSNLIFTYNMVPVTEDPAIQKAWQAYYNQEESAKETAQCLVTGEITSVAATHPKIKGLWDAQSSGASLVSFNAPAFCSYGHTQNYNAPVGKYAAFAYTAALNHLLADRTHCHHIGDTTVICWSEHGETSYQDVWSAGLWGAPAGISDNDVADALKKVACGEPCNWDGMTLRPEEHFYVLGLSPNAGRISVRFFLRDSFGSFISNIEQHYEDISIIRPAFDPLEKLPLWRLLGETVNQNSRNKEPQPQLAGDMLRAVLTNTPYPATLLNGALLRIRAERSITRGRAAILKGYYLRTQNPQIHKEVFTMHLNEESTYAPYVLGRLFSVLEALQVTANPSVNTTIKDKYFNSASATPNLIFPLLLNLAQKHARKLDDRKKVYYNKQITELIGMLDNVYPNHMTLPEQGAFQIGYYHQTQKRYTKKEDQ